MAYDYHGGSWDDETGLNSPLYGRDGKNYTEASVHTWKNINFTVNYWINNGCHPSKINLGLAAYGRSFTLKDSSLNKVGAPSIRKGGEPGIYTMEEGIMSYFEICEKIIQKNWTRHWDDLQQSVFATSADQWVGFDNQRSITLKVKWAISMSLGGTMLWTLDFDDYSGNFCQEGSFPIANTIKSAYEGYSSFLTATSSNIIIIQNVSTHEPVEISKLNTTIEKDELYFVKSEMLGNYSLYNLKFAISNSTKVEDGIEEQHSMNESKFVSTTKSLVQFSLKNMMNGGCVRVCEKSIILFFSLLFFKFLYSLLYI
jgi:hypothetical protein